MEAAPAAEQLAYNLAGGGTAPAASATQGRAFTVLVNGLAALPNLNTATTLLPLQATSFKVPVSVRGQQGIIVDFKAQTGEAFLNGIQVKKLF
jgi:beta-galactosidase